MRWRNGGEVTQEYISASVPEGWVGLVNRLLADLSELGCDGELWQIKEKFGELRFYGQFDAEGATERIKQAQEESRRTCCECGSAGEDAVVGGWVTVLCERHRQ